MNRLKRILCTFLSICLVSMPVTLSVTTTGATDISSLEEQLREYEKQSAEYQAILDKTKADIKEKEAYSKALVSKIEVLDDKMIITRDSILELNESIKQKTADIDQANQDMEQQLDALCSRLRTIYMAGSASDLEILLGAKDFSDLIDKMSLVKILSNYDKELIDDINTQLDNITEQKTALERNKAELEERQSELQKDQNELNELLEENDEILRNLYTTSEDTEDALHHAQLGGQELEDQITAYYRKQQEILEQQQQQQQQQQQNPEQGGSSSSGSSSGSSSSSGGGSIYVPDPPSASGFVWPVPGYYGLTSTFYEDRGGYGHGAIDIASAGIMGATVVASASGYVISSYNGCPHNWGKAGSCGCGGGYGNYVMIDHGNGKMTTYAHCTNVLVGTNEYVSQGQVIGYVGSTGWSTGAHLHYETRYNGVKYDPMSEF